MTTDYAIINTGGKQYRVREGDTVDIERLAGDVGTDITFDRVLMTSTVGVTAAVELTSPPPSSKATSASTATPTAPA